MKKNYEQYGGKVKGLYELKALGFRVPDFIILSDNEINELNVDLVKDRVSDLSGMYFSVRSSANLEDSSRNSFAGVFITQLYVQINDLYCAVQTVFKSKESEVAKQYCAEHNLKHEQLEMNVIIQEMVGADVSGVAFGVDPLKPYKKTSE